MTSLGTQPTIASVPGLTAALAAKRALTDGAFTVAVSFDNGTLVASAPVFNVGQTWNNAAVNFIAGKTNVVDTASGAGSLLHDFQVGGVSVCAIPKYGGMVFPNGLSFRQINGTTIGTYGAFYANTVGCDGGFKFGSNQVVGDRGAAVPDVATADCAATAQADAIDLATALTLVNDLKAKYNAAVAEINETKAQLNTLLARLRAATGHGLIA